MAWSWSAVERLIFGPLIVLAYFGLILFGASEKAEKAPEAAQIIHDGMLTLGPLVGAVYYAVFGRPTPPGDGSANSKETSQ